LNSCAPEELTVPAHIMLLLRDTNRLRPLRIERNPTDFDYNEGERDLIYADNSETPLEQSFEFLSNK